MFNKITLCIMVLLPLLPLSSFANETEIVWSEVNNAGSSIYHSRYRNGSWGKKQEIVSDNNLNILPTLSRSNNGRKIIVWSRVAKDGAELVFARYDEKDRKVQGNVSAPFMTNLAPVVIHDSNNIPWLFWSANNGEDDDIYVARFIRGRWTEPLLVNAENDVPDILPEVERDNKGNILVTWKQMKDDTYIELTKTFGKGVSSISNTALSTVIAQPSQLRKNPKMGPPIKLPSHIRPTGRASLLYNDNGNTFVKGLHREE